MYWLISLKLNKRQDLKNLIILDIIMELLIIGFKDTPYLKSPQLDLAVIRLQ